MTDSTNNNQIIPLDSFSKSEWKGLRSARFDYNTKRHYEPKDQLKDIFGQDLPLLGRKHFEPKRGIILEEKASVKTFPHISNRETSGLKGITSMKKIDFVPPQKRHGHHAKLFLMTKEMGKNSHSVSMRNMSMGNNNNTNNTNSNEKTKDGLNLGLMTHIQFRSPTANNDLGYANSSSSSKFVRNIKSSIQGVKPNNERMGWREKDTIEMINEEKKAVRQLDEWERNNMKVGGEKWKDQDGSYENDFNKIYFKN